MNYLRFLLLIAVIQCTLSVSQRTFAQEEASVDLEVERIFPSHVSHRPGTPQKPMIARPGDRNVSTSPDQRYAIPDDIRSGCPRSLGQWATPSLSSKYTAGYAGGSTSIHSSHSRPRNRQEGTWGLDFTLWGQPKLAWLRWGDGSRRQSNGNFETDR